MKGGGEKDELATNTGYMSRLVLELIDRCKSLEELREAVKKVGSTIKVGVKNKKADKASPIR